MGPETVFFYRQSRRDPAFRCDPCVPLDILQRVYDRAFLLSDTRTHNMGTHYCDVQRIRGRRGARSRALDHFLKEYKKSGTYVPLFLYSQDPVPFIYKIFVKIKINGIVLALLILSILILR